MNNDRLPDFLLARIAEDEETAVDSVVWRGRLYDGVWQIIDTEDDEIVATVSHDHEWSHIARHDPARVLAEGEAKRLIIGGRTCCRTTTADVDRCPLLRALALPYADHPDYRQEWRP